MFTYGFMPFAIMFVCSIIIIHKLYRANKKHLLKENTISSERVSFVLSIYKHESLSIKRSHKMTHSQRRFNSMSKQMQVTSILLTTNVLFFCLVSPLLLMNLLNMLQEDTLKTTIAYFLCYANHGYISFIRLFVFA